jgi:hypothetical protein
LWSLSHLAFTEVVGHADLKLASEDSLFELICERISFDSRFFDVLQFVRFEFISTANFGTFFDLICDIFDCVTLSHWELLRSRLLLPVFPSPPPSCPNDHCSQAACVFPYRASPLDGIISHLTSKFRGNVYDRSVVTITANRAASDHSYYAAKNVADLGTDSYFQSPNEANQSISFDFRNLTITPTHYSLRMYSPEPNSYHLKNWVLEGSPDGNSWIELDRCENNNDLNSSYALKTFSVSRSDLVCVICLREIGPNHQNNNHMIFTSFEVFGSVVGLERR